MSGVHKNGHIWLKRPFLEKPSTVSESLFKKESIHVSYTSFGQVVEEKSMFKDVGMFMPKNCKFHSNQGPICPSLRLVAAN